MYIHIGRDKFVKSRDIIGIFDLDNTTVSKITRDALSMSEKKGNVVTIGCELPMSFILCGKNRETGKLYISPVSAATLAKRIGK
ncbi:MAG: DUF370 domain-containing protein [Clostridiales bacterium]|jgi:hypothetical protein|nr:DUF370 domain-containing protein [Clostridiales bacterium]